MFSIAPVEYSRIWMREYCKSYFKNYNFSKQNCLYISWGSPAVRNGWRRVHVSYTSRQKRTWTGAKWSAEIWRVDNYKCYHRESGNTESSVAWYVYLHRLTLCLHTSQCIPTPLARSSKGGLNGDWWQDTSLFRRTHKNEMCGQKFPDLLCFKRARVKHNL